MLLYLCIATFMHLPKNGLSYWAGDNEVALFWKGGKNLWPT